MSSLNDAFQRQIRYLRLSVTDQCDLRCHYCLPQGFNDFQEPAHWLNFAELSHLSKLFADCGIQHIRLTGGEPLLRKDLPSLVQRLASLPGTTDLSLSTNGLRLPHCAAMLKQAGLRRLNISLDSLQTDRYRAITQGKLSKALDGIHSAIDTGFAPIKINMVVMRGINDDEVVDMLEFCLQHGLTLRYIETMPMGNTGRLASQHYLSLQRVKEQLSKLYTLIPELPAASNRRFGAGPAHYFRIAGSDAKVGFITPISNPFCDTCNRLRLTVDGTLHTCLGQNDHLPLGRLLRAGYADVDLLTAIKHAIANKPQKHEFQQKPEQIMRFMSVTGG